MTSIELAQRLVSYLDEKDISLVTMNVRAAIVDAMNAATQKFYANSPSYLKEVAASGVLRAPKNVTIEVTDGSMTFTGYNFTDEDAFCSILIEGDSGMNQLVSPSDLMNVYLGPSGTRNAVIYSDVIPVYEPIKTLVSDPYLIDFDRIITRSNNKDVARRGRNRTLGEPKYYTVENNARADNGVALFLLRTDRLPDSNYRFNMDVEMGPYKFSVLSLIDNVDIPMRDDHIESYLIPLAMSRLAHSPLWKGELTLSQAFNLESDTLRSMALELVENPTSKTNRIGTPKGW